jgi:hypothetical protein
MLCIFSLLWLFETETTTVQPTARKRFTFSRCYGFLKPKQQQFSQQLENASHFLAVMAHHMT